MMATNERPEGLTWNQTAAIMIQLGCWDAVMCDGGGSSGMMIEGEKVNKSGNRKIYDALLFYSSGSVERISKEREEEKVSNVLSCASRQNNKRIWPESSR